MTVWWRWMRDALSPTADEVERLTDPGSKGWRETTAAATTPTGLEIVRLSMPVSSEALASCRDATVPTEIEINRLLVGLRETERATRPGFAWGRPLAVAGAALAVATVSLLPGTTAPEVTSLATTSWSEGQPVLLNAAIRVDGSADVLVTQTGLAGTRVDLQDGAVWFEVDPDGDSSLRDLLVVAGGVKVRVTGTRFQVSRSADRISVQVDRGQVQVATRDDTFFLGTGESWHVTPEVGAGPLAQVRELAWDLLPDRLGPQVHLPEVNVTAPSQQGKPLDALVPRLALEVGDDDPLAAAGPTALEAPAQPAGVDDRASRQWNLIEPHVKNGDTNAITLIDTFLRNYGRSDLAEEAHIQRLSLFAKGEHGEVALTELDTWLKTFPGSSRAVEVHSLRAFVALEKLSDCAAARASLDVLSSQGAGADAATASASLGSCAVQRGDDRAATAAFELALSQDLPANMQDNVREELLDAQRRERR